MNELHEIEDLNLSIVDTANTFKGLSKFILGEITLKSSSLSFLAEMEKKYYTLDPVTFRKACDKATLPLKKNWVQANADSELVYKIVQGVSDVWLKPEDTKIDLLAFTSYSSNFAKQQVLIKNMALATFLNPKDFLISHVLFWLYLAGLVSLTNGDLRSEETTLELLNGYFLKKLQDADTALSLSILAISLVGIFGTSVSPARILQIQWPAELNPRQVTIQETAHLATLGEAMRTLSSIRSALKPHIW